jgi:hypothetical protein
MVRAPWGKRVIGNSERDVGMAQCCLCQLVYFSVLHMDGGRE